METGAPGKSASGDKILIGRREFFGWPASQERRESMLNLQRSGQFWSIGRVAWLLVALHPPLIAGLPGEAAPLFTRMGDPVSVPAEIVGHAMFVNVRVNGQGPFRVLVDTGCSVTLISPGARSSRGR